VLDFAAGSGRHALLAHALGARVLAVDRNAGALASLDEGIETEAIDLEEGPWRLPSAAFDAVIVTNYLFRPRFALLCGLLAPSGLLIYETFARGNEAYGKPSNPAFLLTEGELYERARLAGLAVVAYESGFSGPEQPAIVQRLCAVRPPFDPVRLTPGNSQSASRARREEPGALG
jgi:SAM-dependent methyltransferase